MQRKRLYMCLLSLFFVMSGMVCVRAQSSYIDLTLVSSADYNKPLATFSHDVFEQVFCVSSDGENVFEPDLDKALVLFISLLEPKQSFIIQHEPTYYFVFQYNKEHDTYIVMNNSIGEKNEAIFADTVEEARQEMLKLLQVFYSNTPVFNVTEYRY